MKKPLRVFFIVLLVSVVYIVVTKPTGDPLDDSNISRLDVSPLQVYSTSVIGDTEYIIYHRNSLNIPLEGYYVESGVLYRKVGEEDYKKLVGIIDNEERPDAKNNVFKVWEVDEKIRIMIVDHLGAGSGEGMAKVLSTSDNGESWIVETCFYYTPEHWEEKIMVSGEHVSVDTPECANFAIL